MPNEEYRRDRHAFLHRVSSSRTTSEVISSLSAKEFGDGRGLLVNLFLDILNVKVQQFGNHA